MIKQNNSIGLVKANSKKLGISVNKIQIFEANIKAERIKDFKNNNQLKPLIDLVGKWRYYIGIREDLSQEEMFMNINFIRENFNELNLIDINQAINLSLKGDLNVDVEHYQNFTPLYISKILKAYKEYKGKIIFEIRDKLRLIQNKPKEPSAEEKLKITKMSLSTMYDQKDEKTFYDYGGVTWDFIKRNNLIVMSKELVKEAMEYGKKENLNFSRNSAYKDAVLGTSNNLKSAREKKEFMVRACARNYVVRNWLKSFTEKKFKKFLQDLTPNMI